VQLASSAPFEVGPQVFDGVELGRVGGQPAVVALALLRCADPGRLKANLRWDQIAKTSSSNATATRRLVGSSTASS
jgi:hypothetical protein